MMILKVDDNSQNKKSYFADIQNLISKISDKTLEQLEKEGLFVFPKKVQESKDITRKQMIIQSVNDSYCTGNVMGYLGYKNERLIIKSRFGEKDNDYFLQYLLSKVLNIPNIVDLDMNVNQENRLFNMWIFFFPYYLKTAMRKGVFKTYIRYKYNDKNVKGTIDIARHISKNTPFMGNIAYSQREYSYDNYLMELVRHTIGYINKKPYGNMILSTVKDEVRLVIYATSGFNRMDRQKILLKNRRNIIRHAYYREYQSLQELCLLILQHQKHQVGCGQCQIYGILFDGAWLWEEYMNTLLKDIFYHPMNKEREGVQWLFAKNKGKIYPDFIGKNTKKNIIADAKYKPIDNIHNKDYLQLLAYMFRFDAKQGYYLYPDTEDREDLKLFLNKGSKYESNVQARNDIFVVKHGLKIPINTRSYDDFVLAMNKSEEKFIDVFEN